MDKLPKFNKNVNNIQQLSDRPNTADGLTPDGLKEKFDKAGADIKIYLNEELVPEIDKNFDECLKTDDSRLTDARKCNNTFEDYKTARENLKIKSGTTLPTTVEEGCIFLLY